MPNDQEETLIKELIPLIEKDYRVWPYRQARVIYGVSKAGGGCTRLALKYPWMFAASTPLDGVMELCDWGAYKNWPASELLPYESYEGNIQINLPALKKFPLHMFAGSHDDLSFWNQNIASYRQFKELGLENIYIYNLTGNGSYCTGDVICKSGGGGFSCGHGSLCTDWRHV